jgi:L-iditol 2-dehydrogenase
MVKAAVLVEPGKIEIQEFPRPQLGKGAAIAKMVLSGICGTDKHSYKGESVQNKGTKNEIHIPYPIIQGHENVLIIEEIDDIGARKLDYDGNIFFLLKAKCPPISKLLGVGLNDYVFMSGGCDTIKSSVLSI